MMRILIIKLGAIGDVIRTTSILHGLKEIYKECSIEWVTKQSSFDVLKNNNLISNAYLIERDFGRVSKDKFDLVISMDDEEEACRLVSAVKAKRIIGAYMKDGKRDYSDDSSKWFDMGLISKFGKQKADELKAKNKETYQKIIYDILQLGWKKQEPMLVLDRKNTGFAEEFAKNNSIGKNDLIIGINTGAGGRWEDKKLSIEKTALLIKRLSKLKCRIILFGGPEENERNKRIKEIARANIIDAGCNNPLLDFAALVNLCNILVTSDSLALHIGTALKKKIVAFFCPTSPHEIELYGRGIKILPKKGCLCCYKSRCDIPPDYDVNEIVDAVKQLAK